VSVSDFSPLGEKKFYLFEEVKKLTLSVRAFERRVIKFSECELIQITKFFCGLTGFSALLFLPAQKE